MRPNTKIRSALLPAAIALVVAPLLLPAAATAATPSLPADACTVTEADAAWGIHESLRAAGVMPDGAWELSGGVAYEESEFRFTGGTGSYDPATATGSVSFPGSIRFTGLGGRFDAQLSAPTVVFTGPDAAELRADISGTSVAGALAGDTTVSSVEQVPLVSIDLTEHATVVQSDHAVRVTAVYAPTALIAAGFESFGDDTVGAPFDPISLTVEAACPTEPSPEPTPVPMMTTMVDAGDQSGTPSSSESSWLPWGLGALAALVLSAVASIIVLRRRPRADGPE
ncbi:MULTISPECIES: HtaA domain-containing protein [unclassified Microbacterium]|uniref:HtaA domain-containing protein n=1 Tax=unclassified Microbacterium TaxID=2609290 RepID=UPI00214BFB2D|nr:MULTISPECIES: HtaA domain-containing protein [unclassified Microbacterium]MCR2784636.1 HtaA domain-containing protein [Microbacterium sp. zg.B96]MDL5353069.1 HtaA domain-containing protein [Microbacterium sp. zg-YB36]WIM16178.1 HtaA domain-containing protein [Microbacterium sp. zg-B96]